MPQTNLPFDDATHLNIHVNPCNATQWQHEVRKLFTAMYKLVGDVDKIEDFLMQLSDEEREELYNHETLDIFEEWDVFP